MNISKMIKPISINLIALCYLFISTGCEPDPKMIGYGSNEYSQLEFPGTNWNHEPLVSGYQNVWAGGNFSIALIGGGGPSPSVFLCKGDSTFGQCDIPGDLDPINFLYNYPPGFIPESYPAEMSLGLNHAIATILDTFTLGNVQVDKLFMWGDNSLNQTNMPNIPDTVNIAQIAAGNNHNLILIGDPVLQENDSVSTYTVENKRLIAWGDNTYGQCDVPEKFNPIADSLTIIKIDAGANHNLVLYDSSGVTKMAAWGDNTYGQSEVLSSDLLTGNNSVLKLDCGYNHNIVVTYDTTFDYYADLEAGNMIDELVYIFPPLSFQTEHTASPVTIHAWGDNSYGQTDIPELSGIYEGLSAGGYHNNIVSSENLITNFAQGPNPYYGQQPYTVPQTREITGWGKNDFGQTEFPIEYIFDSFDFLPDPNGVLINSSPTIFSGENHNLVIGAQLFRAPSMSYNFPERFNGAFGDTNYQTLTLRNIGPDTLFIDSLFINSNSDTVGTHPFYMEEIETQFILYGDSTSFQIYSIFDSAHSVNEYGNIQIYTSGWFEENTIINLNSYFGPVVNLQIVPDGLFYGLYDEQISREVKLRNNGNATVFIDSMEIRNDQPFYIEPLGDESSIEPGDSLSIYIYTTLLDIPYSYNDIFDVYISNFNTQRFSIGLNARRYHKVGDLISEGISSNYNMNFCSEMENVGLNNTFNTFQLDQYNTKIHHFDFGAHNSGLDSSHVAGLNALHDQFIDYPSFLSMIHAIPGIGSGFGFNFPMDSCYQFLEDYFPDQYNVGAFILNQNYWSSRFSPTVESVVINEMGEITYLDTFNLDSVSAAIGLAIDECGLECISRNSLELMEDTSFVSLGEGSFFVDSVYIQNGTGFDLNYSLSSQSGSEIIRSAIFESEDDYLVADVEALSSAATISLWLKPLSSDWSDNNFGYTNFISPIGIDTSDAWKILLESNTAFARIGWQKGNSPAILSQSPLWHANDTWYHCVFVFDVQNQVFNMYKNGIWEATSEIEDGLVIGEQLGINVDGPGFFHGFLSKTAFWNNALSPAEISYLYEMGANNDLTINNGDYISALDLSLYWDFNDSDGSTVSDHSGNNFHATLGGYLPDRWHTSVLPSLNQWLSPMTSNDGTAAGNSSNISLYRVDAANLSVGTYYGMITLNPEQSSLQNSRNFVKLVVTENLASKPEIIPLSYSLHQNYPNPFNPITEIRYELPVDEFTEITIYDLMGRNVKKLVSREQVAGFHSIKWNATNNYDELVSAGMYFYTIKTDNFNQTRKMMLLK
ncbi:MAG: LamG-like jellyroll fold domain-containing protein [Candidatus Neomarinimicrobiota bacterium]